MARNLHTILGSLAVGAGLLFASASPAAALSPPPDDGPGLAPNQPLVSIGDAYAYEADGFIQFPISLSKPATQITFVGVKRTNDTTNNADFTGLAAPLSIIPPGGTTSTITFPLADDAGVEDPEHMTAEIVSATGGVVINDGEASGTIYDGDGPVLGATMNEVDEGDPGDDVALSVEATLSYAAPEDISFRLQTQVVGFGAVPGDDFVPVDAWFTIPAGSTSVIVPVDVVSDNVVDDDDGVVMAIASNPSVGTTWNNTPVGKILDDDEPGSGSGAGSGGGSGTKVAPSGADTPSTADGNPTSSTTESDRSDDSDDAEMTAAAGSSVDDSGSGFPFLPVAGLLAGGFGVAWWAFAKRDSDEDDTAAIDATGVIHLD
jgi:large repetitive protein